MKSNFSSIMKITAAVSSLLALLFALVCWLFPWDWAKTCLISCGTTAYHFTMRLAVGYGLLRFTDYRFDYRHPWFRPRAWESAFYQKLNLKRWKGKLPTYAPGQFSMEENTLYRIIQNMCGAELVHEIIMVLSFLPLLAVPFFGAFPAFLITSLLSALFDSIFVMAQRFNRPRLVRIYEKQEAKRL